MTKHQTTERKAAGRNAGRGDYCPLSRSDPVHSDTRILQELKSNLQAKIGSHSLILFGSRANGKASVDSDMDILVVADRMNAETEMTVSECAWEIGLKYGVVIVPVTYSRDDWENGPERSSLLALAVNAEGISV